MTRNFNTLNNRNDVGAIWENYLISERWKFLQQNQLEADTYFWRTTQQQEIDYIEQAAEKLLAIEFKWNDKRKKNFPSTFTNAYPKAHTYTISKENKHIFLTQAYTNF